MNFTTLPGMIADQPWTTLPADVAGNLTQALKDKARGQAVCDLQYALSLTHTHTRTHTTNAPHTRSATR